MYSNFINGSFILAYKLNLPDSLIEIDCSRIPIFRTNQTEFTLSLDISTKLVKQVHTYLIVLKILVKLIINFVAG